VTDALWLAESYIAAGQSADRSTQVGAVVVLGGELIGVGWNRFVSGVRESPERWERPAKYDYIIHAEVAATISSLVHGWSVMDATLYCSRPLCTECARVVIESGITRVVGHQKLRDFALEFSPDWTNSIAVAVEMCEEAGVTVDWFDGPVDAAPILVGGTKFDPSLP
jgi:dCMP deaminase